MKNWLYIPFLVLMAVTYTRVSENFADSSNDVFRNNLRRPASIEEAIPEECLDLPARLNPHALKKACKLIL